VMMSAMNTVIASRAPGTLHTDERDILIEITVRYPFPGE